jgi:hypothetical protein
MPSLRIAMIQKLTHISLTIFKILRKRRGNKKQHYSRLLQNLIKKINTIWNVITKGTGKVQSVEQVQHYCEW